MTLIDFVGGPKYPEAGLICQHKITFFLWVFHCFHCALVIGVLPAMNVWILITTYLLNLRQFYVIIHRFIFYEAPLRTILSDPILAWWLIIDKMRWYSSLWVNHLFLSPELLWIWSASPPWATPTNNFLKIEALWTWKASKLDAASKPSAA